jgi:hypothetical protein
LDENAPWIASWQTLKPTKAQNIPSKITIGSMAQTLKTLDSIKMYKAKNPPRKKVALVHICALALGDVLASSKYCSTLARVVAIKTGLDLLLNFNRVFIM